MVKTRDAEWVTLNPICQGKDSTPTHWPGWPDKWICSSSSWHFYLPPWLSQWLHKHYGRFSYLAREIPNSTPTSSAHFICPRSKLNTCFLVLCPKLQWHLELFQLEETETWQGLIDKDFMSSYSWKFRGGERLLGPSARPQEEEWGLGRRGS